MSLGLTAAISATNAVIQKKIYESGRPSDLALRTTALIISNEKMERYNEIVKSFEESGLLIKGISETIKNEVKEQKGGFFPMISRTLAASVSGNGLKGKGLIRAGEGTITAVHDFKCHLIL